MGVMKNAFKLSSLMILTSLLMSCSPHLFTAPTATPTSTRTPTSTPIPTQTLTATPTKTLTATPTPLVKLGENHVISQGGFSIRVPIGYASQVESWQIVIADLNGTLIISFAGVESSASEEEIIDEYLDAVASRSDGEFIKTPSEPVTVNGIEATAFDLTGSLVGNPLQGKALIVPISEGRFLFALAIANISEDENAWKDHGAKVLDAIIESIEFVEIQREAKCPIATDDTYGYTKENAIRVGDGGEIFGGPARERAYLDNLRGPNGEPISYEREGSLNFEDSILDEYAITGLGTPVRLYIDIYKFEELKAPAGFTCVDSFDLKP